MRDDLIDRLRGIYTLPVNDGAGLLDGKDTFTRVFETPPIHHEAAEALEALRAEVERLKEHHEAYREESMATIAELSKAYGAERSEAARLREALTPFAALVHEDGVEAPHPTEWWAPRLVAAKAALAAKGE